MTQKAVGTATTSAATTTASSASALATFDPKSVKQAQEPPKHYQRADTGAEGFWRGAVGDSIRGVLIGPAHEGLAEPEVVNGQQNPNFPRVVVLSLLDSTVGGFKANDSDDSKQMREFKAGELIYVNVWTRTRDFLTKRPGTEVFLKVIDQKKIDGGKTVKICEAAYYDPNEARGNDGAPALTSGQPSLR